MDHSLFWMSEGLEIRDGLQSLFYGQNERAVIYCRHEIMNT